jgi:hypothetical protein
MLGASERLCHAAAWCASATTRRGAACGSAAVAVARRSASEMSVLSSRTRDKQVGRQALVGHLGAAVASWATFGCGCGCAALVTRVYSFFLDAPQRAVEDDLPNEAGWDRPSSSFHLSRPCEPLLILFPIPLFLSVCFSSFFHACRSRSSGSSDRHGSELPP